MKRRGQVWVETVIYTLIGMAIIGLVLAVALPKIEQKKDAIAIEQAIEAMGNIDGKIYEVLGAASGNKRVVDLEISKGRVIIDGGRDTISWVLDSGYAYSEVGVAIPIGRLNVTTTGENPWKVELKLSYGVDIRYDNESSGIGQLDVAPTPYKFVIENVGNVGGNIVVDLSA